MVGMYTMVIGRERRKIFTGFIFLKVPLDPIVNGDDYFSGILRIKACSLY